MENWENRKDLFLDGEIFKNIEEYNGDYQISNLGRIKSFKQNKINGKILKQDKNDGYLYIKLSKNGKTKHEFLHILLFENFVGEIPKGYVVHHLDFDQLNNNLNNFKLMNNSEHLSLHNSGEKNPMYGKEHSEKSKQLMSDKLLGKVVSDETKKMISERMKGEKHPNHILTEIDIPIIRELYNEGILTHTEMGFIFGVHRTTISDVKRRKTWKHIK